MDSTAGRLCRDVTESVTNEAQPRAICRTLAHLRGATLERRSTWKRMCRRPSGARTS